jgi:hypothetical protein
VWLTASAQATQRNRKARSYIDKVADNQLLHHTALYHHLHPHNLDKETILIFLATPTRRKHRDHDLHNRHPHQAPQRVHRKSPRKLASQACLVLTRPVAADSPCYRVTKSPLKSLLDRHTAESSLKVRSFGRRGRLRRARGRD